MLFPDVSPSRDECFSLVASALLDPTGRIYLDASVLIHCYEMSAAASEDLLRALETYDERVFVPAWAAKETWEYTTKRLTRHPLKSGADKIRKELARFRSDARRYIDDETLKDATKEEYLQKLQETSDATQAVIKLVSDHEPKADVTTARLLPFIEKHRLPSDLTSILDVVTRTASMRLAHRIPPGFGDVVPVGDDADDDVAAPPKTKGKQKNPHGDLIIWLEILEDCRAAQATNLILVTRDTTKDDWIYAPKKVRDDQGRPQNNAGLVTLPLPLLVHEATQTCRTLQGVHIVSVEMLAHVLRSMKVDVDHLSAALQAGDPEEPNVNPRAASPPPQTPKPPVDGYRPRFGSRDMAYDFPKGDAVDALIRDLQSDSWRVQNQTVKTLEPLLPRADRDQRTQIGRSLIAASNNGALDPVDLLRRVLANANLGEDVRSDLLIGALAEIYISETGEPKKPVASASVIEIVYEFDAVADLKGAYRSVMTRLRAQSRKYLALPGDRKPIPLEIFLADADMLRGASADGKPLMEEDAPPSRTIQRTGRDAIMTTADFISMLSQEFVVPAGMFETDFAPTSRFTAPELIGYVSWGPQTGTLLR